MNCATCRRRLMESERYDLAPPEVQRHLDPCPACQAWRRNLLDLERQITKLPVPPSTALPSLLRKISEPAPANGSRNAAPLPAALPFPGLRSAPPKERGLRKIAVAFALAAAMVILAVGLWAWPRQDPIPPTRLRPDPLAFRVKQLQDRLAAAPSAQDKVQAVADLADELRGEAKVLARSADGAELALLATWYGKVVREHLPEHARALPPEERHAVLEPILSRLLTTESEVQRLLSARLPSATSGPLEEIAQAAREGHDHLRAILNG